MPVLKDVIIIYVIGSKIYSIVSFIILVENPSWPVLHLGLSFLTEEIMSSSSTCSRNILCTFGWGIYDEKCLSVYMGHFD